MATAPTLYFKITETGNVFDTVMTHEKPFDKQNALNTLKKVEEAIKKFKGCELKFIVSNVAQDEILYFIFNRCKAILDSHRKKYSKTPWKTKEEKEVQDVFSRIEKLVLFKVFPLPGHLQLAEDVISNIAGYLNFPDLARFARLNQHARAHAETIFIQYAKKMGCEGKDSVATRDHLSGLMKELRLFKEKKVISDDYFSFKDFWKILHDFKLLTVEDIFTIFSCEEMYPSKEVPALFPKFRLFLLKIQDSFIPVMTQNGSKALKMATSGFDYDVCKLLLKLGAKAEEALLEAVSNNALEFVSLVLKERKFEASYLGSVLGKACELGRGDIVKVLLDHGASLDTVTNGYLPLHLAIIAGDIACVQYLLKDVQYINTQSEAGFTPLILACKNEKENVELVKLLLDKGADSSLRFSNGSYPLHFAAQNGHAGIVSLLLERGSKPFINSRGGESMTPLCFTCDSARNFESHLNTFAHVARILLKNCADPNIPSNNGSTPICYAAQAGYADLVAALHEAGAEINHRGDGGLTPLHFACKKASYFHQSTVGLLVIYRAKVNLLTNDGRAPLDIASLTKSEWLISFLKKIGARLGREILENPPQ